MFCVCQVRLTEHIVDDLAAVDVQAFTAGDFQAATVESQKVQDGGMQVGYVVALAECMVAEFIGGSVNVALF